MQPIYLTQTSSGSSPWKLTNWHCTPVNIGVSVACNSSSTFQIDYTLDDVTGSFPEPDPWSIGADFLFLVQRLVIRQCGIYNPGRRRRDRPQRHR
jgi:hypothetical protein